MDISIALDAVGGEFNAFTAKEYTCFHARVLDDDLPLAVDVLGDMVTDSLLREEDVEAEREVILDEIAMHDDDPDDVVHNLFAAAGVGRQPARPPDRGHRRVDHRAHPRPGRALPPPALPTRRTSWSPPPATSTTPPSCARSRRRSAATGFLEGDEAAGRARHARPARRVPRRQRSRRSGRSSRSTWCSASTASPATTTAATRSACSTPPSAAVRRPGCSRRCASAAAWPTASSPSPRHHADAGLVGVSVGCLPPGSTTSSAVVRDELARVAAEGITARGARAWQGPAARRAGARAWRTPPRGCRGSARPSWSTTSCSARRGDRTGSTPSPSTTCARSPRRCSPSPRSWPWSARTRA